MNNADVRRTLYGWDRRGAVVQTACKYIIHAHNEDLDAFSRRAAKEAATLGKVPFEVVEKPEGTPVYAILYLLNEATNATIPPEFWQ